MNLPAAIPFLKFGLVIVQYEYLGIYHLIRQVNARFGLHSPTAKPELLV